MPLTFQTKNIGCRVNRAELDELESFLKKQGFEFSQNPNFLIINSCCVTNEAEAKTKKAVRQGLNSDEKLLVYVIGCSSRLHPKTYEKIDKNRVRVFNKAEDLMRHFEKETFESTQAIRGEEKPFYKRPNIKIQDGCNKRCSYCCVWQARGPAFSLSLQRVIKCVQNASEKGAHEVVLCGIDIGNYKDENIALPQLLQILQKETDVSRFRLSSIEPTSLSFELFSVIANSKGRIAPYLHVPLQSGSDSVLNAMKRLYSRQGFINLIEEAKKAIPSLALSTDLIVGFPGETYKQFCETKCLIEQLSFSNLHVFKYSERKNTEAAQMDQHINPHIKYERSQELIRLKKDLKKLFAKNLIGHTTIVSLESARKGVNEHLLNVRMTQDVMGKNWTEGFVETAIEGELLVKPSSI